MESFRKEPLDSRVEKYLKGHGMHIDNINQGSMKISVFNSKGQELDVDQMDDEHYPDGLPEAWFPIEVEFSFSTSEALSPLDIAESTSDDVTSSTFEDVATTTTIEPVEVSTTTGEAVATFTVPEAEAESTEAESTIMEPTTLAEAEGETGDSTDPDNFAEARALSDLQDEIVDEIETASIPDDEGRSDDGAEAETTNAEVESGEAETTTVEPIVLGEAADKAGDSADPAAISNATATTTTTTQDDNIVAEPTRLVPVPTYQGSVPVGKNIPDDFTDEILSKWYNEETSWLDYVGYKDRYEKGALMYGDLWSPGSKSAVRCAEDCEASEHCRYWNFDVVMRKCILKKRTSRKYEARLDNARGNWICGWGTRYQFPDASEL
jgi:hypothetical protein